MVNCQSLCAIIAMFCLLMAIICLVGFGVDLFNYYHGSYSEVASITLDFGRLYAALVMVGISGFWFALWFLLEIPFLRARRHNRGFISPNPPSVKSSEDI